MITTTAGLFWVAVPAAFAAIILFIWGIIETQANLYRDLQKTSSEIIVGLQSKVSSHVALQDRQQAPRRFQPIELMHSRDGSDHGTHFVRHDDEVVSQK